MNWRLQTKGSSYNTAFTKTFPIGNKIVQIQHFVHSRCWWCTATISMLFPWQCLVVPISVASPVTCTNKAAPATQSQVLAQSNWEQRGEFLQEVISESSSWEQTLLLVEVFHIHRHNMVSSQQYFTLNTKGHRWRPRGQTTVYFPSNTIFSASSTAHCSARALLSLLQLR